MRLTQAVDWFQPVLVLVGRAVFGVLLGGVLSVIGIGIAWAMFVFFGAVSHVTLMSLYLSGSGTGAAVGSLLAWTRIDHIPRTPVLLITGGFCFGGVLAGYCTGVVATSAGAGCTHNR